MIRQLVLGISFFLAATTSGIAADTVPAVVYGLGGKFDKSFNEGVYQGAERFKKETGVSYRDFEIANIAQVEQALRHFARHGMDPILAVGFSQAAALNTVAREFPKVRFTIIDSVVDLPNVQSIVFKEHEGSFLVGMLAAMKTQNGKIGFVGGMDIPLIRKFACAYVQGAQYVNKDIVVYQNMTGSTGAAWSDPVRGGELAKSQLDRGAEVIYQAAGGTGIGVLQAAADAGKFSIGTDSNQNHLHPGSVLTTMLKRVDVAAYKTFMDARNGTWKPGISVLGLKEGGVGWSLDKDNEALITPSMKSAVQKAEKDIIDGAISVHDYMTDNACPY